MWWCLGGHQQAAKEFASQLSPKTQPVNALVLNSIASDNPFKLINKKQFNALASEHSSQLIKNEAALSIGRKESSISLTRLNYCWVPSP